MAALSCGADGRIAEDPEHASDRSDSLRPTTEGEATEGTPVLVGFRCELLDIEDGGLTNGQDPGFESADAAADAWMDAFERASGASSSDFIEVVTALGLTFSYHDAESGELAIRLSVTENIDGTFVVSESAVCSPLP